MGQAFATSRFYFYGKEHFTRTGWLKNSAPYRGEALEAYDLRDRVSVVTGANSGIGRQVAEYLAARGSSVYMVCRNSERAETERKEIVAKTGNDKVHVLVADCGLASDVRRVAEELRSREQSIHCLVCNAGALSNQRTLTSEGVEVTFATHLLCGTYLLVEELKPLLRASSGSRAVVVSSGGMYNTKYDHDLATGAKGSYNGQLAYAYAKRGQVLLCERWAEDEADKGIAFVSCHPGWTDTPGVDAAYSKNKKWLQPLRSQWEGSEGICWLCAVPQQELESGAFYLDRSPQPKHLPASVYKNYTTNKPKDVDHMMTSLETMVRKGTKLEAYVA